MTIALNQTIPNVNLKVMGASGPEDISTDSFFKGKTTVLVGVTGAFTSVCTKQHIPGYAELASQLKEKGIDQIACVSVNDPFVMSSWAEHIGVSSSIKMLSDWNGTFAKALGVDIDLSTAGLGTRMMRFAMIIKDGIIVDIEVEENPKDCTVSSANSILKKLKALPQ